MAGALQGKRVVVPETRELEVLAQMLARQGAEIIRCPLVQIVDAPDPAPIEAWLRRLVANPPDDVILLTGEGLTRLLGVAARAGCLDAVQATLGRTRLIVRGPKPQARLRAIGLSAALAAGQPTTAGLIETLRGQDLRGRRVAVQLYPEAPNTGLLDFLREAGAAPDAITPYAYVSREQDAAVLATLRAMAAGEVDLIVFTSSPQLRRLQQLTAEDPALLAAAFARTRIAAVGPLVAAAVTAAGGQVAAMPAESFHMKPMVGAILAALG